MEAWDSVFEGLRTKVGQNLGLSDWFALDQHSTDVYAALISDLDPFHNDPNWEGGAEWGGTVIVGTHGLSLIPSLLKSYGLPVEIRGVQFTPVRLEKARFISPLLVGKRARDHAKLVDLRHEGDSWTVTTSHTMEVEGGDRPFMSAVFVSRYSRGDRR